MKKILFLDDSIEFCNIMKLLLEDNEEHAVTCYKSYSEVASLTPSELNYDFAFLDVNLGPNSLSGIEVFDWLMQNGFKGKIIFFTGHARSYPLIKNKLSYPNVQLLEKPSSINQILKTLDDGESGKVSHA